MNKPVAWINTRIEDDRPFLEWDKEDSVGYINIPLYTHPVEELTPCEELRAFQEQQNGVFSEHNACCYRHECRTVWNDWEKIRSNPAELTDEEIMDEWWHLTANGWEVEPDSQVQFAKAILRKAQEK